MGEVYAPAFHLLWEAQDEWYALLMFLEKGGLERRGKSNNSATDNAEKTAHLRELAARRLRERLLEGIAAENVFSTIENPTTGGVSQVVDTGKLRALVGGLVDKGARYGGVRSHLRENLMHLLPEVLGSDPVLTHEQVARSEFVERPLFYVPETVEAVATTANIKNARFHYLLDDVVELVRNDRPSYPTKNVVEGQNMSALEARTAVVIFHPNYGNGYRDEHGRLLVQSRETGQYVPFSGAFLESWGIVKERFLGETATRSQSGQKEFRSMREGAAVELPHLVANGLIVPFTDFRQTTLGSTRAEGARAERAGVSPSGARMIRGVLHYIGKQFRDKPTRILEVSPTVGAVVDVAGGRERVTHIFNIVSRAEAKQGKSNMFLAGASLTNPRSFSAETIALPQRSNENREQYLARLEATDKGLAHLLLHVFPEHPALANMLRDKPLYEQAAIAQAAYLLERDHQQQQFDSFVDTFGEAGVRTFLVTANNDQLRAQVLTFSRSVSHEDATSVFERYADLISSVEDVGEYLQREFGHQNDTAIHAITERMLQRGERVLSDAYTRKSDPASIAAVIESISVENAIFVESFRALKEREPLSLQDVASLDISRVEASPGAFSDQDVSQMKTIVQVNYAHESEAFREAVLASMVNALNRKGTDFHTLRFKGQIIGFNRFDTMENAPDGRHRRYFGSFNVDQSFAGGKLGEAMIEQTVLKEAEESVIEADCNPRTPITSKYIESGFNATSIADFAGVPSFHIVFDTVTNESLSSRKISAEEVVRRAEANERTDRIIFCTSDGSSFEYLSQGYALTRFLRNGDHWCCAFEKPASVQE